MNQRYNIRKLAQKSDFTCATKVATVDGGKKLALGPPHLKILDSPLVQSTNTHPKPQLGEEFHRENAPSLYPRQTATFARCLPVPLISCSFSAPPSDGSMAQRRQCGCHGLPVLLWSLDTVISV
jgi:hypothetical protein